MLLVEDLTPVVGARRGGRRSVRLGVAGLLTTLLLPLAVALDLAAIVVGLRARRAARAAGEARPGNLAGVALGTVGLALCAALLALVVSLWTPFADWTDCVRSADSSSSAEHACKDRLRADVHDRIGHDLPGLG
jgi:hypothetical protein